MPEGDHDLMGVARHRCLVVAVERTVGESRTAQIDRHHAEVLGQKRHHMVPFPPGFRPAVKQKDRRAGAPGDGVEPDAVRRHQLLGKSLQGCDHHRTPFRC